MDDAVIGLVRDIIAKYGIDITANARRLENFLADLSKKRRLENAALVAAVKEGIPAELRSGGRPALPGIAGDRLVQLLRDNQGLDAEVARWAVRAWAQALDVTGLRFRTSGPARPGPRAAWPTYPDDAPAQVARLIGKALTIAQAIADPRSKALALASLAAGGGARARGAAVPPPRDRDEATRLLDSAESLMASIPSWHDRTLTLHAVATAIVAADPDRAEKLARSIHHRLLMDSVLSRLVGALMAADPDRALRLAWAIREPGLQAAELTAVAARLASTEPDRAERLAGSLAGNYWRAQALSAVAAEVAGTEPDRAGRLADEAERLAREVPDPPVKVAALGSAAGARHLLDAGRAAEMFEEAWGLARAIEAESDRARAFGSLAVALVASNPRRAIALAGHSTWYAGNEVAKALAETDPGQAIRKVQSLANPRRLIAESAVLVEVARTVARADPDEALRLAWSIGNELRQAEALVAIARALMITDRDRATKLLADVERSTEQVNTELHKVQILASMADAWAGEPERRE